MTQKLNFPTIFWKTLRSDFNRSGERVQ